MHVAARPKAVVLGLTTKMPFAGIAFMSVQYVLGLQRLGFEVFYVEEHGKTPWTLMRNDLDADGPSVAAAYISNLMERFGLEPDHWAFWSKRADDRRGLPDAQLNQIFRDAALVLNLHGGTTPRPEHYAGGRLVYMGTDPVEVEVGLFNGATDIVDYLEPHCAFFTWGENHGNPDCGVPVSERFTFVPSRQPMLMDLWTPWRRPPASMFTTIGNWRQPCRTVELRGELYHWSKHLEFLKFIDLPVRTGQSFELAMLNVDEDDRQLLESNGWQIRDAWGFTLDVDRYREYIGGSRGEFTVAKDQNVRLRSGWFSDRAASYLATGRPVITQETGFSNILPTGEGLFAFSTIEDIVAAVSAVNADYERHCRRALEIAHEYFDYRVVLGSMLGHVDAGTVRPTRGSTRDPFPRDLVLTPTRRWPTTLSDATAATVASLSVAERIPARTASATPDASVVIVTHNGLPFTRLCLESVLTAENRTALEVVVVDNASSDGTREYLQEAADCDGRVTVIWNAENVGFGRATNQGVAASRGGVIVCLNNDTIPVGDWLDRLSAHLTDERTGVVGAVTNRAGNEAEIDTTYHTYGEMCDFAVTRADTHQGLLFDIRTATLFCAAMRRGVWEAVGALDERFEVGLFEDDDLSMRVRGAGYRVVCAEDVFVHHFGQASIGQLGASGEYGTLFHANRRRWEQKWERSWEPYTKRPKPQYAAVVDGVRQLVRDVIPASATVVVLTKGDGELLDLDGRRAWHFPQAADGSYTGYNPPDSEACIAHLEQLRLRGAEFLVIPEPSRWWLDYYADFARHLDRRYAEVADARSAAKIIALREPAA